MAVLESLIQQLDVATPAGAQNKPVYNVGDKRNTSEGTDDPFGPKIPPGAGRSPNRRTSPGSSSGSSDSSPGGAPVAGKITLGTAGGPAGPTIKLNQNLSEKGWELFQSAGGDSAAITKLLREAEATAQRSEAHSKAVEALLKQIEGMTNKTDESSKLYAQLRNLWEDQHRASEEQRRAIENARRAAEAGQRSAGLPLKLKPNESPLAQQSQALQALKEQIQFMTQEGKNLKDQLDAANASGQFDAAAQYEQQLKRFQVLQLELQKRAAEMQQRAAEMKARVKEQAGADAELMQKLSEYNKLLGGAKTDGGKPDLSAAKDQIKSSLEKQFDSRQKQQLQELKQLRERLEKLEKEMSDRENKRSEILNERLDQLLSGNANIDLFSSDFVPVLRLNNGSLTAPVEVRLEAGEILIDSDAVPAERSEPTPSPFQRD